MDSTDIYIHCCPVCGNHLTYKNTYCNKCKYSKLLDTSKNIELHKKYDNDEIANRPVALYISNYPIDYYEYLSEEKYGNNNYWEEIFILQELSKNPLFNQTKYKQRIEEKIKNQTQSNQQKGQELTKPKPKCPTCGSTNVYKIPNLDKVVYALAIGLFSNTARSQFCCNDCGYKW